MKRIVVPIPVYGRLPLVKQTITRLYSRNNVYKVICVGHEPEAARLCQDLGAEWVEHPNYPLAAKWNAGFKACEKHDPDGVLFTGSSDWISDDYLTRASSYLSNYHLIGTLGCHFADVNDRIRVVYWEGYKDPIRKGEPIGIGRILSKSLLKHMKWKPFDDRLNSSLDWSMWSVARNFRIKILDPSYLTMSISHKDWPNKHKFENHWLGGILESRIVTKGILDKFPEIYLL